MNRRELVDQIHILRGHLGDEINKPGTSDELAFELEDTVHKLFGLATKLEEEDE